MKNTEITLKKQFIQVTLSHLKISFALALLFGLMLLNLWSFSVGRKILCVLVPVIYFLAMAGTGHSVCERDLKSYSTTKPFISKGFLLALPILAVNLILWAVFKISWTDNSNLISVLVKLIFYAWTFPFTSCVYADGTKFNLVCYILMYTLPPLASGIGYFIGYKRWDIGKVFRSLAFEKKQ